jgi:uncharacterized membrane protein
MNWHEAHLQAYKFGDHLADKIAGFIGSWKFIIFQSAIFFVWVLINTLTLFGAIQFDPYPFILFNLFMSAEAAYSSPLILMSQNRQAVRDRHQAEMDYQTNQEAKAEIEELQSEIARIEIEKLDLIRDQNVDLDAKLVKLDHILDHLERLAHEEKGCNNQCGLIQIFEVL